VSECVTAKWVPHQPLSYIVKKICTCPYGPRCDLPILPYIRILRFSGNISPSFTEDCPRSLHLILHLIDHLAGPFRVLFLRLTVAVFLALSFFLLLMLSLIDHLGPFRNGFLHKSVLIDHLGPFRHGRTFVVVRRPLETNFQVYVIKRIFVIFTIYSTV